MRARHEEASAPARRRSREESVAAAVATEKPGPPSALTTTLASPAPEAEISPAVEQRAEVVRVRAEDDEQLRVVALAERAGSGLEPGAARVGFVRAADREPASCDGG